MYMWITRKRWTVTTHPLLSTDISTLTEDFTKFELHVPWQRLELKTEQFLWKGHEYMVRAVSGREKHGNWIEPGRKSRERRETWKPVEKKAAWSSKQTHSLCSDTDTSNSTDRILIFLPYSPPNKTVVHWDSSDIHMNWLLVVLFSLLLPKPCG